MRAENRIPGESNCFQVNKGVQAVYNDGEERLESLSINGKPVEADNQYTISLQEYHYKNSVQSLNLTIQELTKLGDSKIVTTSAQNVLEEYLIAHQLLNSEIEGRLVYK
jgi:5'-nucleotidase